MQKRAFHTLLTHLLGDARFHPQRLSVEHLSTLANRLDASRSVVARAVGIAPSTVYRTRDDFTALVSDRVYRVAIVVAETMNHFRETPRTLRPRSLAFAREHLHLLATYDGEQTYRSLLTRTKR